jgi:hypothetical protein
MATGKGAVAQEESEGNLCARQREDNDAEIPESVDDHLQYS